ncbi:GNAT superfamily N-acetyltransferase [Kribbella aluminosa]|uniref:GNAT superfamily N-acetyltransferase n=1 Tax=Kribbella aluminosa TaxID=416017 RepID=A0ABS4UG89_9ACTN|nr:GNAT family N-acetyltransferase [Kribbella aluminosa]MBP2350659.1 GNAT superfamily N-acetyltransferase [Kribbella aluminosa]
MQQPEIRLATVDDAEAGAWCHLLCWREAYAGLVPDDVLLERTADIARRTGRWQANLGAGRQRWIALNPDPSATVQDRVAGFIGIGPGRDEDAPVPFELEAIYTRQAFWKTGLGTRLLDVAVGKQPAFLWVFEGNARALAFYQRHGFEPDGTGKYDPYFDLQEIRLVRA